MVEQSKIVQSKKSRENLLPTTPHSPSPLCNSEWGGRGFSNKGVNLNVGKNVCVGKGDLYIFGFVSSFYSV